MTCVPSFDFSGSEILQDNEPHTANRVEQSKTVGQIEKSGACGIFQWRRKEEKYSNDVF